MLRTRKYIGQAIRQIAAFCEQAASVAQLTQRGRFKIVLSERSSNIETSGSPMDLRQETKPERDMRWQDYRHVAGALIIRNEERPARASTVFEFWALV